MSFDLSKAVVAPHEGEALIMGPPASGRIIIKIDPEQTGETRLAMGIQVLEAGAVVPVHHHESLEELIFVYAGRGRAVIDDEDVDLGPGTTLYLPRRVWHGFRTVGDEPLRVTWTVCPAGLERFFRELGTPAPRDGRAPAAPAPPLDREGVLALGRRHGFVFRGA